MKYSLSLLLLTACNGVVLVESTESSGPDTTTITSTESAATTTTTDTATSTSTDPPVLCSPEDAFEGSDGCYVPDELCCPGVKQLDQPLAVQCSAQTEGAMPVAFVCNPTPEPGAATDDLKCLVFKSFICQGVEHVVLCCEVEQ